MFNDDGDPCISYILVDQSLSRVTEDHFNLWLILEAWHLLVNQYEKLLNLYSGDYSSVFLISVYLNNFRKIGSYTETILQVPDGSVATEQSKLDHNISEQAESTTINEFVHNLDILFDALTELSDLSIQLQKRDLSLMAAHKLIERTISILESIANKNCEKTKEVNSAYKADPYKDLFNNLLIDLTMLSSDNGPDNCDVQFGDINISRLSKIYFKLIKDLVYEDFTLNAVKILAITSAECERSFSSMNEIVSSKRSVLTSDHISSLAFINCTGPPINKFNPNMYIKTWILSGKRTADEQCCPKRKKKR
ncbi:hypothetical protein QTP88_019356 [Uroleucon formosanum]